MGEFSKRAVVPTYPIDALDKNCENVFMFLREKSRTKDGKTHRYWSVVENRRVAGGGVVQLDKIELRSPREWGACWLGLYVWDILELDTFWKQRLPSSRKGTSWLNILKALTCYRLIDPGKRISFSP